MWLQKLGAAVISPNVRGSDGYGKHYMSLDNGFKREDSVRDIGALLDWIATKPDLDENRVAVFGAATVDTWCWLAQLMTVTGRTAPVLGGE